MRTCIVCRKRENPNSLLRVILKDGAVLADPFKRIQSRGASIHRTCVQMAVHRGAFRNAFKLSNSPDTTALLAYIDEEPNEMDAKDMKLK
ncbi:unannotated protein [freshwater metagenome]|uniref:Unannotated protein n=1 Tax=freshwater metagenome TaxID=449393 RepID=A0A6J7XNE9_9ZZZZ|nr:DUF448 domain-containing protein [Actinomycetota bacterium]